MLPATITSNTTGSAASVSGVVPIGNGGTGASTAGVALTNLGAAGISQNNTYTTGAQSFAAATSLTVPTSSSAAPTISGQIAYNSTNNELVAGINGTTTNIGNNVRSICYIAGADNTSAPALTVADSQNSFFVNMIGTLTITKIQCQVNSSTGGISLTDDTQGFPIGGFACGVYPNWTSISGSSITFNPISLGDSLDFTISSSGLGTPTRITVCIAATVN
jgi:hypothetical protein